MQMEQSEQLCLLETYESRILMTTSLPMPSPCSEDASKSCALPLPFTVFTAICQGLAAKVCFKQSLMLLIARLSQVSKSTMISLQGSQLTSPQESTLGLLPSDYSTPRSINPILGLIYVCMVPGNLFEPFEKWSDQDANFDQRKPKFIDVPYNKIKASVITVSFFAKSNFLSNRLESFAAVLFSSRQLLLLSWCMY